MRSVSEISDIFDTPKEVIKEWAYVFSDYLSSYANPTKGQTRFFTFQDIRVLALIYYYWEDDPDYENIYSLLNTEEYNEDKYLTFAYLNTPIFANAEFTDLEYAGEEAWTEGAMFFPMAIKYNFLELAKSYKLAGDILVEKIRNNPEPVNLSFPAFFSYRHAIELYLKFFVDCYNDKDNGKDSGKDNGEKIHDLEKLIIIIQELSGEKLPKWFKGRICDFHTIDPYSVSFRYTDDTVLIKKVEEESEFWVSFFHLKTFMDNLCEVFEKAAKILSPKRSDYIPQYD